MKTTNAYLKEQVGAKVNNFRHELISSLITNGQNAFMSNDPKKKSYDYIPYGNHNLLTEQLLHIKSLPENRNRPLKFIDVGCGIGLISQLAYYLGYDAYGLELRQEYLDFAECIKPKPIFNNKSGVERIFSLMQGDAMRHDYSQYDVIYYYCPMCNKAQEKRFEARVERMMKTGAYLIPKLKMGWHTKEGPKVPYPFFTSYGEHKHGFEGCIFTKGKDHGTKN